MNRIRIITLVENSASGRGTRGEHGLSFWIDTGSHRVLFDTGQTAEVLTHNAQRLNIDLAAVDAVVLSHGHYDHTGGLTEVLGRTRHPALFLHPAALQQRYSRHRDGCVQDVGITPRLTQIWLQDKARVTWTPIPTEILSGLRVTGEVPRVTDYEDTGGNFYLDQACTQSDPIVDDQAVFFDTPSGIIVVLGCAHAGVVNTLRYIQKITDNRPIHAVLGGMHLIQASPRRIDETVAAIRRLDVKMLAPAHCTGPRASARLWSEFPDCWQPCPVGATFEFERVAAS